MRSKRYGPDVLAEGRRRPGQGQIPRVAAERGLVVEDAAGEFCGAVVWCEKDAVTLEDGRGRRRVFPLRPGAFRLEGKPVMLVRPARPAGPDAPGPGAGAAGRTASGSIAAPPSRAKVARASRIYVEGQARRRARREDLGRRPARCRRRRGVPRGHRRPARDRRRLLSRARAQARRPGRSPGGRVEGDQDRCAGAVTARADRRAPVHRRLGGGQAVRARHPRLAPGAARPAVEGRHAGRHRVGAGHRGRLAAHPALGDVLHGPGARVPRPG